MAVGQTPGLARSSFYAGLFGILVAGGSFAPGLEVEGPLPSPGTPVAGELEPPPISGLPDRELALLLERARNFSPTLARARASAEAGLADVDLARSAYLPEVGASERYSRTDDPVMAFMSILNQGRFTPEIQMGINDPGAVGDWTTSLYARYLLTDFGGRRAKLEAARQRREQLRLLERAVWRDVRFEVTAAYYALLEARASVRLWEETVRLFETHEGMTRDLFEAGAVLRSDLLTLGVRRREAEENLLTARHEVEISRARLAQAVGVEPSAIEVPRRALERPAYEAREEEVVVAARRAHPRILALEALERSAEQQVRAAARSDNPRLELDARLMAHGDDQAFGLDRESWAMTVVLDVPLFDAGRSRAATRGAAARRDEIAAMRREARDALDTAARTAHRRVIEALGRVELADAAVEAAAAALDIVEERYGVGMARVVDLVEAERQLTAARVRALQARAGARTALAAVERVAGGERSP